MYDYFSQYAMVSGHGEEDAHEGVEEDYWVEAEQFAVGGQEGLEELAVGAGHEPEGATSQQQVQQEGVDDPVHYCDCDGKQHDGRGTVYDEAESLHNCAG